MRKYTWVEVGINGQLPQKWNQPADQAHDFAADLYANVYQPQLGEYKGTRRLPDGAILDTFEKGYIRIGDLGSMPTTEPTVVPPERNARFWMYVNGGPVKITLHPGRSLRWFKTEQTDEGWASELCVLKHEGDHVERHLVIDGCDCDGRLTIAGSDTCPLDQLASGNEPYLEPYFNVHEREVYEGVVYPAWSRVSDSQCDEYAEDAGY